MRLKELLDREVHDGDTEREMLDWLELHGEQLIEALDYVEHSHWRCTYRSRYGKCLCGLDALMEKLGLPPVPVSDPEAPR